MCEFDSLGIDAPDDPPDMKLVPGFNEIDDDYPEDEPDPVLRQPPAPVAQEPTGWTKFAVIVGCLLLLVCLILIVITIGLFVYYECVHKKRD